MLDNILSAHVATSLFITEITPKPMVMITRSFQRRMDMRDMSCDQFAPIIAIHSALQSDSAVYSAFLTPDKSASSGVRPGSNGGGFKAWSWFSSRVTICSGFFPAGKKIPTSP